MPDLDQAYFDSLPKMPTAAHQAPSAGYNPLLAGVTSGTIGLGADLAGFGGAAARAFGATGLASGAESIANRLRQASSAASLPEYEQNPWSVGGMAYQVAKAVPTIASLMVGGEVAAPAKVAGWMSEAGRVAPRLLGGAGGAAGEAAEKVGSDWARHLIGGGIAGYPVMAGGAYNEQLENGGPSQPKAALALGVGAPEAALGAIMPAQLRSFAESGLSGDIAKRLLTSGAASGAANMVQGGVQAALNQPFMDPNTSFADRAHEIVKSALLGGAVGGLFGAAHGALGGRDSLTPPPKETSEAPATGPSLPRQIEYQPEDGQLTLPGMTPPEPRFPMPPEGPMQGPADMGPQFPGFDQPREAPAPLPSVAPVDTGAPRLGYQPQSQPLYVAPGGDTASRLGVLDQRAQAPAGYQHEMFGQPLQEPMPPIGPMQDRPGYVGPQAPGFDGPGAAPAPLPDLSVARRLKLTPSEISWMNRYNKTDSEGAVTRLRGALSGSDATPFQTALAKKLGILEEAPPAPEVAAEPVAAAPPVPEVAAEPASQLSELIPQDQKWVKVYGGGTIEGAKAKLQAILESNNSLSGAQMRVMEALEKLTPKETKNAVQERSAAPVDAREQAGPSAGVRGGDAEGVKAPGEGQAPEAAAAQAPVESAAQAPAPVEGQVAPPAGPVELAQSNLPTDQPPAGEPATQENPRRKLTRDEQIAEDRRLSEENAASRAQFDGQVRDLAPQNMREQAAARDSAPLTGVNPDALRAAAAGSGVVRTVPHTALPVGAEPAAPAAPALKRPSLEEFEKRWQAQKSDDPKPLDFSNKLSPDGVETPQASPDQGVMDAADAGGNVLHALSHIANTSPDRTQSELAAHLFEKTQEIGGKTSLHPGEGVGDVPEGWERRAQYDPQGDTISLGRTAGAAQDVMHEAVHPLIQNAADANSPGWRVFSKLFARVSDAASPETKADPTMAYAFGAPVPEGTEAATAHDMRAREFSAELWSNPDLQAYVKSQNPGLWQSMQNAYFRMIGAPERMKPSFKDLMDVSKQVMEENAKLKLTDGRDPVPGREPTAGSVPHSLDVVNRLSPITDKIREKFDGIPMEAFSKMDHLGPNAMEGFRKIKAYVTTLGHIGWELKRYGLGQGEVHDQLNRDRSMIASNMAQVGASADTAIAKLSPRQREQVNDLMAYSPLDIDPTKSPQEHTWLTGKANYADLMSTVAEANKAYRDAKASGAAGPYEMARAVMDGTGYAEAYSRLYHGMRQSNPGIANSVPNAVRAFKDLSAVHGDPVAAREFWKDQLTSLRGLAAETVRANPESQAALSSSVREADLRVGQIENGAAYFSAQHGDGDYFAGARIATGPDGQVRPEAIAAVSDALRAAKFDGLVIRKDLGSDRIFFRMDTPAQQRDAARVLQTLEKAGHIVKNDDGSTTIKSGRVSDPSAMSGIGPKALERDIAALRAQQPEPPEGADATTKAAYADAHEQAISAMIRQWLGSLPNNSLSTVLQERKGVQGHGQDMVDAFRRRVLKGASSVADYGTRADVSQNLQSLRSGIAALKEDPAAQVDGRATSAQIYADEIYTREANKAWTQSNPYLDAAQAAVSTLHVGSSPAVGLMMLSQIPMYTVPQLVKNFPYRRVIPMLGKTSNEAFKTVRAVMAGEYGSTGGFSHADLVKEIGKEAADFHMAISNGGGYTGGTFTHMMADNIEGSSPGTQKAVGWANGIGRYTELLPRVWTAAAARDLYNSLPKERQLQLAPTAEEYALRSVLASQKDYSSSATSRFTGKAGPFGPMTPLMLSFTAFQTRALENIYREVNGVLGRIGATPEERKTNQTESGKWLLGHAAATMTLAGTLGLPGAALMAGAYDKIATALTGQDDTNVEAAYRKWLDGVFGPQVGGAVARGVPRLAGIDLSDVGFQNIIPFTRLMTDKRKFEDAENDFLHSMSGAAFGDVMNVGLGARDVMNGDYMLGLQKIVPEALRSMVEAYRAETLGYINKDGTPLPLQPTHLENLLQAVGIEPARKADYDEVRKAEQGLNAQRQYRSNNIERHLMLAQSTQDSDAQSYWRGQALDYMRNNPGLPGPLQGFTSQYRRQMDQGAMARGFGMPLGVKPNDLAARSLTDFGAWRQ